MKININIKKTLALLVISYIFLLNSFSQDTYIKNRLNLKLGYARYTTGITEYSNNNIKELTVGNYRIEANYGILNYLEIGAYFGYSRFDFFLINWADTTAIKKRYNTPFYGVNCNFHILPFLIKKDDFRFDLYITGKYGGLYFTTPGNHNLHGHQNEYGIGAGFSLYIWKHLGLYTEYSYGKYYFDDKNKLRYGLSLKF
ncbi:MAG: outer membrane beta-barrel protein [Bacteroidales bacterium]